MRRVILNFHGLGTPNRPLEPGEDAFWVEPGLLDTALDLAVRFADQAQVMITFDDGNASDIEVAAPVLGRRGQRAMFFVLADRIGQAGSLGRTDLRTLLAEGHSVGSHGGAHADWRAANGDLLGRELRDARRVIEDAMGQPVRDAAIPFGRWNRRVMNALRRESYGRAYSSDGGAWRPGDWPIPRTSVRAGMTAADLEGIVVGREPLRARVRRMLSVTAKRLL